MEGKLSKIFLIASIFAVCLSLVSGVNLTSSGLEDGVFENTHIENGEIVLGNGVDDDALAGYWDFESRKPDKVFDTSGNGNDGTPFGEENNGQLKNFDFDSDSGWKSGIRGPHSLRFDGQDDYVSAGSSERLSQGRSQVTVSAWIKPSEHDENYELIAGNTHAADSKGGFGLFYSYGSNDFMFQMVNSSGSRERVYSGGGMSTDEWHHLVVTFDSGNVNMYSNGTLIKQIKFNGDRFQATTRNFLIGKESGSSEKITGRIDEVAVYNRSLAGSEIKRLYRGRDVRQGIIGEWNFDSGSGSTAYDTSKWRPGIREGSSMKFDGQNDFVNISDGSDLSLESFSLSAWVYRTNRSSWDGVIVKDGSYRNYWFGGWDQKNCVHFRTDPSNQGPGCASGTLPLNEWTHITGVHTGDEGEMRLYVNGNKVAEENFSGEVRRSRGPVGIGGDTYSSTPENLFDGRIDQARVYTRALTGNEVKELYDSSRGYFTSRFINGEKNTSWKDFKWIERISQNTDIEARLQTASKIDVIRNSSEWLNGSFSVSGATGGLAAYWRFEDSTVSGTEGSVEDWSGNEKTAITKNNVDTSREGFRPQSNSYRFGSDEYLNISSVSNVKGGSGFSVSFWINDSQYESYPRFMRIGDVNWQIYSNSAGDLRGYWSSSSASGRQYTPTVPADEGEWTLYTHVYNGTHNIGYKNGHRVGIVQTDGSIESVDSNVKIGGGIYTGGGSSTFEGKLDEVRIYNRSLSTGEVRSLYSSSTYTSNWIRADKVDWVQWTQTREGSDLKPVAQWRFDGGSGQTATDSSRGYNGTLGGTTGEESGDPSWKDSCLHRGCLKFDGQDDVVVVGDLDITGEITETAWVKPDTCAEDHGTVATKNRAYYFQVHSDCRIAVYTYWNNSGTKGNSQYTYSNTAIPKKEWSHIAFVEKDDGTRKIYINGQLDKTYSAENTIWESDDPLQLGAQSTGGSRRFDGKIDDIRIYERAISSSGIKSIYRSSKQGWKSTNLEVRSRASEPEAENLVGAWNFEGTGQTVLNNQEAGENGVLGTRTSYEENDPDRAKGYSGKGLSFNGTNELVTLGQIHPTGGDGDMSVSAWVKSPTSNYDQSWATISSYDDYILGARSSGTDEFGFIVHCETCSDSWNENGGTVTVPNPSEWNHFVGTYNASTDTTKLYLNGELINTATDERNGTPSDPVELMHRQAKAIGSQHQKGKIDEVRIYNKTLSATEAASLYKISDYSVARNPRGSRINTSEESKNQSFTPRYYQFKLNSITGTSSSIPVVEKTVMADTSGWTDWKKSPDSSPDIGSAKFVQAQFKLSSSESHESPVLDSFSILEGLSICDSRGPLNECIANTLHSLASEIISVTTVFKSESSAEFTSTGTATLNITNSSILSGVWTGSFSIESDNPTVKPGAAFKPENGSIRIGN